MNIHLENIANVLKGYSISLAKSSILIDKPWSLIDEEGDLQRLIFKKNKELIISKNGQASLGKWEYLPQAKSLLLDRGKDKILCNEFLFLNGILILKKDGTKNDLFILCNENEIPDLDPIKYLIKIRSQYMQIINEPLKDGRELEFIYDKDADTSELPFKVPVTIDFQQVADGIYYTLKGNIKYIIKNSTIRNIFWQKIYYTVNNRKITIDQHKPNSIQQGDFIWYNNLLIEDGTYTLPNKIKITTQDGKVLNMSKIYKRKKSVIFLFLAIWICAAILLFINSTKSLNLALEYYLEAGYTKNESLELIKENRQPIENFLSPFNIGIIALLGSIVILLINHRFLKSKDSN